MYAVTGITGQVGGVVARCLLQAGAEVRAVVRDASKGRAWAEKGCDIAIADMMDAAALASAFEGVEGVFILVPPIFDPAPGFPEIRAVSAVLKAAIARAKPPKVVFLSTIGAQVSTPNLLSQLGIVENELGGLDLPLTFLRAAWFMENAASDVASARDDGKIASFLQPVDHRIPMVATADIGRVAADLLQESWSGLRIVNLAGPSSVSPIDLAEAFSDALGHDVSVEPVPRALWEATFTAQGAKHPEPRARMIDGFNEGWIKFDGSGGEPIRGLIPLQVVIADFVHRNTSPARAGHSADTASVGS